MGWSWVGELFRIGSPPAGRDLSHRLSVGRVITADYLLV